MNEYCISQKFLDKIIGFTIWGFLTGILIFGSVVVFMEFPTLTHNELMLVKDLEQHRMVELWCIMPYFSNIDETMRCSPIDNSTLELHSAYAKIIASLFLLAGNGFAIFWYVYEKQSRFKIKVCADKDKLFWKRTQEEIENMKKKEEENKSPVTVNSAEKHEEEKLD